MVNKELIGIGEFCKLIIIIQFDASLGFEASLGLHASLGFNALLGSHVSLGFHLLNFSLVHNLQKNC